MVGDKSTLQLAAERLTPEFAPQDIFVSTGKQYVEMVREQLPFVPHENIIAEPEKRDVGPAVGLIMGYLAKKFPHEPVVILWSDHLVKKIERFKKIVLDAGSYVENKKDCIVFIGQKPRFASENLGWIKIGEIKEQVGETKLSAFAGFKYRPSPQDAQKFFDSRGYCWNLGYFVSTPSYIYSLFQSHANDIFEVVEKIVSAPSTHEFQSNLLSHYKEMPEVSFDNAVLEQIDHNHALVVDEDIGWSDVGAWEALKEALEHKREDNITKGRVLLENAQDCLVYNYEGKKMIVGVELDDILVVNTDDVLLVARKSAVAQIKKIVEGFQGTENEKLT